MSFIAIPGYANNVDVNGNYAYVAAGATGLQIVDVTSHAAPSIVAALDTPGNANDVVLVGTHAYIADGPGGLRIVDITNPLAPASLGSVTIPGNDARDVQVAGGVAYMAGGAGGLSIVDVSNAASPVVLGSLTLDGEANGVALAGTAAVVAAGWAGVHVVNIVNPAAPALVTTIFTSDARDVTARNAYVFIADLSSGLLTYDLTDQASPAFVNNVSLFFAGAMTDVAATDLLVFGADAFNLGNQVSVHDITNPFNPIRQTAINFSTFRNGDAGSGLALDSTYVYLTASAFDDYVPNGVDGDTRLYIGQYAPLEDHHGIPPTVTITTPAPGATFVDGETIPIAVTATDDVAVSTVTFLVDGVSVFTDTAPPYEHSIVAPLGFPTLLLGASASDVGNNAGFAANVPITIIPDPLTTVVGRVVDNQQQPLAGATVRVLDQTGTTGSDGRFSIPGVRTAKHLQIANATVTDNGTVVLTGTSAPTPTVRDGTTDVGDIVAAATRFETDLGQLIVPCTNCGGARAVLPLPFPFPIVGTTAQEITIVDGYVYLNDGSFGGSSLTLYCCVNPNPNDPASGAYVNDTLPGRYVVTWLNESNGINTQSVQLVLFADGRIQYRLSGRVAAGLRTDRAVHVDGGQHQPGRLQHEHGAGSCGEPRRL